MLRHRKVISTAGKLLVAAACLVLMREHFNKELFLEFLQNPSLFLLLIGMWILNQFLVSWRLGCLFSVVNTKIPMLSLVRATFVSSLFTSILPGVVGADLAKIVLIRNLNPDKGLSLIGSGIFLDRVLGLVTLILLSIAASIFLPWSNLDGGQKHIGLVVWLLGGGMLVGWIACLFFQRWFMNIELSREFPLMKYKIFRRGVQMIHVWKVSVLKQIELLGISAISVGIIVLVQAIITGILLQSQGFPFSFATTMFIFPALTIISALPITPLGLGVGQLAIGQAFQLFGLPPEVGVTVTTLSQLTQGMVALIGGGGLFWLSKSDGTRALNQLSEKKA